MFHIRAIWRIFVRQVFYFGASAKVGAGYLYSPSCLEVVFSETQGLTSNNQSK